MIRQGKPLFEMCCFHMGLAQIALGPSTLCQMGTVEHFSRTYFFHLFLHKRSNPPYHKKLPIQTWKKSAPNHPGKPLHIPPQAMPISKRGFPYSGTCCTGKCFKLSAKIGGMENMSYLFQHPSGNVVCFYLILEVGGGWYWQFWSSISSSDLLACFQVQLSGQVA